MDVLGITAWDGDSAACLVRDGRVIARAEECLFTRRLGESEFPRQAVEFCLRVGKIGTGALDAAVLSGPEPYPGPTSGAASLFRRLLGRSADPARRAARELESGVPFRTVAKIAAHATGSFLSSPLEEAAILVLGDGYTAFAAGRGGSVQVLESSATAASDPLEAAARARKEAKLEPLVVGGPRSADRDLLRRLCEGNGNRAPVWIETHVGADATGAALHDATAATEARRSGRSLGPGYNSHQIRTFLRSRDAAFEELSRDDAAAHIVALLAGGESVAWFSGRVETGGETAAARSVLRLPGRDALWAAEPEEVLAVPVERAAELFALDPRVLSPLVASESGFVLRVDREENRAFHSLLGALESAGLPPVVIARPLARPGEPIACTPRDAWEVFESLPIDAIVMERHLVRRS